MTKVITFVLTMVIWFLIIAFITSNTYILTWHWAVKLTYVLLGLYALGRTTNKLDI